MVSFSVHYNSIFSDRIPCKHKNWQFHVILIIPFQISLFSPHLQKLLFQLINVKSNHSSTSDTLEYRKSCTKKKMLHPFLKTASYMKILKSLDLNRDHDLYRRMSNQNLNQRLEICKRCYTKRNVNNQKKQKSVQGLDGKYLGKKCAKSNKSKTFQ